MSWQDRALDQTTPKAEPAERDAVPTGHSVRLSVDALPTVARRSPAMERHATTPGLVIDRRRRQTFLRKESRKQRRYGPLASHGSRLGRPALQHDSGAHHG